VRLIIFSLALCGCVGIQRPDTDLCINNAPAKHKKCYNMLRDYDDNGKLKPGAKAFFKPLNSINDVNKDLDIDPKGLGNLKAYINQLKDEYQRRCQ
jgi:hypothetical protein